MSTVLNTSDHSVTIPVVTDVNTIPVKPRSRTPGIPFTYPTPKVLTKSRDLVRVVLARHQPVILDSDLAEFYGTTIDAVNKAAMRNACRFNSRSCFRLTSAEWHQLLDSGWGTAGLAEADRGDWLCAPLAFNLDGAYALAKILGTFEALRGSVLVWAFIGRMNRKVRQSQVHDTDEHPLKERRREKWTGRPNEALKLFSPDDGPAGA